MHLGLRGTLTLALSLLAGCAAPVPRDPGADLVLTGGRVWTGDEATPWVEALAIAGERIVAAGSNAEVAAHVGSATRTIELDGRWAGPGFIDNHTHFNRAGELLLGVNLLEVADADGLREAVASTAARLPEGAWMLGGSWGAYEQWQRDSTGRDADGVTPEAPFRPDRAQIDAASPHHPALLWNWDRSQFLANTAALDAAGADCSWDGVECVAGRPTGRLSSAAAERVRDAVPEKTMEQRLAEARVALARLARHGVTTIFDITPPEQVEVYHRLRQRGELTARVHMRLVLDTWDEMRDAGIVEGFGDDWIRYQGLKGFVDGIMGNSSARFYEPYRTTGVRGQWRDATNTGHVSDHGSGWLPDGNMRSLVLGADAAGFNPRVHAIGDEAIDRILDVFEEAERVNGPRADRRFAIIHTQVIRGPETARRMADLGVVAEMQPYHAIDDMRWMEERIGERARWAYAFRTLAEAGVLLSFGSDWPGTNASWYTSNPLHGIYAAVTRQTLDGRPVGGWFPEERIDVETALRAYTTHNARVAGEESAKGKLLPGFLADVVVLDADPLDAAPATLADIAAELTVVGGRVVFEADTAR